MTICFTLFGTQILIWDGHQGWYGHFFFFADQRLCLWEWRNNQVAEHLPTVCKALGLVPSTTHTIYLSIHLYIQKYMHTYANIHTYLCVCIYMHVYMLCPVEYLFPLVQPPCMQTCIYTRVHSTCTHVRVHTHGGTVETANPDACLSVEAERARSFFHCWGVASVHVT